MLPTGRGFLCHRWLRVEHSWVQSNLGYMVRPCQKRRERTDRRKKGQKGGGGKEERRTEGRREGRRKDEGKEGEGRKGRKTEQNRSLGFDSMLRTSESCVTWNCFAPVSGLKMYPGISLG